MVQLSHLYMTTEKTIAYTIFASLLGMYDLRSVNFVLDL